jgi:hypothetical protein
LQQHEAIEGLGEMRDLNVVASHLDSERVATAPRKETRQSQPSANEPMNRRPVLQMGKVCAATEDMRLVIAFQTKALPDVEVPDARLKRLQRGHLLGGRVARPHTFSQNRISALGAVKCAATLIAESRQALMDKTRAIAADVDLSQSKRNYP